MTSMLVPHPLWSTTGINAAGLNFCDDIYKSVYNLSCYKLCVHMRMCMYTQFRSVPEVLGDYHSGWYETVKSQEQGRCRQDVWSKSVLIHTKTPFPLGWHRLVPGFMDWPAVTGWVLASLAPSVEHCCSGVCSCPKEKGMNLRDDVEIESLRLGSQSNLEIEDCSQLLALVTTVKQRLIH